MILYGKYDKFRLWLNLCRVFSTGTLQSSGHSGYNAAPSAERWQSVDRPDKARQSSGWFRQRANLESLLDRLCLNWYGPVELIATITPQTLTCKHSPRSAHTILVPMTSLTLQNVSTHFSFRSGNIAHEWNLWKQCTSFSARYMCNVCYKWT